MPSFGGELATTIPDARLSIRSFLVNIILPIRLVRRTAYFPLLYNGVLRCNAICTGPPLAVRGPARASAPALRFLGISDRGSAFNREVRTKSLCKCPVRLWLPCLVIFVLQYHHRFLGLCTATVPSPSNRRCTRTDRQAIARNITFSKPGVVVALVLKPNSSLMDSMAVTWLSPGSTSLCTSLAILWQIALMFGATVNVAPLRILVSLASVKSSRIYRATSAGTSGGV